MHFNLIWVCYWWFCDCGKNAVADPRGHAGICPQALNLPIPLDIPNLKCFWLLGATPRTPKPRGTTTVSSDTDRGSAGTCFQLQVHHDMINTVLFYRRQPSIIWGLGHIYNAYVVRCIGPFLESYTCLNVMVKVWFGFWSGLVVVRLGWVRLRDRVSGSGSLS